MNDLPNEWKWKKLGDMCEIKKGNSITKEKITPGTIPVIAGGQQPAYYHNLSNRTGKTITISASGAYAGFVNFFEIPLFASDCTTIKSLDEKKISTKYIYLILKHFQKKIYALQTGAGQPHVYAKDLSKLDIPIPPLSVQKQIVAILERAESLKQKREETNKETNKIVQSIFYEMFGDPIKNNKNWTKFKLVDILKEDKNIVGGPFGSNLKVIDYRDNGIPIMRLQNIKRREFKDKDIKFISKEKAEELKYHSFKSGDIILAKLGSELGICCIVPEKYKYGIVVGDVIRIRIPENTCNKEYLLSFLNSKSVENLLNGKIVGATRPRVNLEDIRKILIPTPPLKLQNDFAKVIEKIDLIKQKQIESTKEINKLFSALMKKAFVGELI